MAITTDVLYRRRKGDRAPRACSVYRFYDEHDRLLYVGVAVNPSGRFRQHEIEKSWWPEVATIRIEQMPTSLDAIHAEQLAIVNEKPKYNVVLRIGY